MRDNPRTFFWGRVGAMALAMWLAGCAASATTGSIRGVVTFVGEKPKPRVVDVGGDPYCQACWKAEGRDGPVVEPLVLGEDNSVQNVLVWISDGLSNLAFDQPKAPVVVELKGCRYAPHVSVVRTRQPLIFRNRDETLHNVHTLPRVNVEWGMAQPVKGMDTRFDYSRPEVGILVKCDVHAWEYCYVHVLTHPYFDVTGKGGTFEIRNLPPGEYELSVWHELKRLVPDRDKIRVKVEVGKTSEMNFTFRPRTAPAP